jgi:signal peptidase I
MAPALQDGDWLVAVRARRIRPGALIVVEHPERPGFELVKRVTALPGEMMGARALGPNRFWVTGDRGEASTDSRSFGPVSGDAIRGVVVLRYWPPGRAGLLRPGDDASEAPPGPGTS